LDEYLRPRSEVSGSDVGGRAYSGFPLRSGSAAEIGDCLQSPKRRDSKLSSAWSEGGDNLDGDGGFSRDETWSN